MSSKDAVRDFWDGASCGEQLYLKRQDATGYEQQAFERYRLEPYISEFARFELARDKDVLEIGVGLGADHQRFAQAGARLAGIDLTPRAIEHTQRRLAAFGLPSRLQVGDAENLPFVDASFDLVYSWGVLHHSPDTRRAVAEVFRVLKPGGVARVMIYHKWSMVGLMLYLRYGLLRGRPWSSLATIYASHLESPGTKAYSTEEALKLFDQFERVETRIELTHADLLESGAGQRHQGVVLALARKLWPRRLIRQALPQAGLFLLIEAQKGA